MITFWRTSEKYGCFSNFSKHPITIDGKVWPTAEHFYQACKTDDEEIKENIRQCKTPREAKQLAYVFYPKQGWDEMKYEVMVRTIREKVKQHPTIKELLLSTDNEEIGESSPYDYIWGIGKDGSGDNWLGKIWVQIREEIKSENVN